MLLHQIKLEMTRIFNLKRNLLFFVLFILAGLFFVYSGIMDYQSFLKEKEFFLSHEQNKIELYVNYSHYGDYGFRVLFQPSPLVVFFNNSSVFENLYSNVDMTEILDVNRSYKGRNLLFKKGVFKDLAGIFFLFGSLFMVYMGMTSYKSEKYYFKFGNILIRLIILNVLVVLLAVGFYYSPGILHMSFSPGDGENFSYFSLYLLCFLGFFFGGGVLIRVLFGRRPSTYTYVFIFWFLSIAIIPETMNIFLQNKSQSIPANEKYNITKLEEVMNFERKVQESIKDVKTISERNEIYQKMVKIFLNTGYIENSRIEMNINRNLQKVMHEYEKALLLYPTSFYHYLSGEVSGKGFQGYLNLVNYTLTLRHNFVRYYLKKRYESNDKTVVSFIKNGENVFLARSIIPRSFPLATGFTLLYTMVFFIAAYVILKKRGSKMPEIEMPGYRFRKGNTYFVLCKNDRYRDNLFRYYQENKNTIGIDKVAVEEVDQAVGMVQMVAYLCKFSQVEEKKAWENLRWLGVEGPAAKTWKMTKAKEKAHDELIYKIYCAVAMAGNQERMVVNDFLKGKSRELERYFLNLVTRLNAAGKSVIYLSSEIFLTSLPFEGDIKIENYKSFRIDPQAVSLR